MKKIKVLKNNLSNIDNERILKAKIPYPRKLICENCESELEYEEADLRMGEYGCMYIDCPVCGQDNMLEDNENSINLTIDNIEFPIHFNHVNSQTAKDIFTNEEIKKYLREAIEYFRKNKNDYAWGGWITANLFMYVHRYSDDEAYDIIVSNDFYNIQIPFEAVDYE